MGRSCSKLEKCFNTRCLMHKHGRANPKQRQPLSWRQQANTKQTNYIPKNIHMEPKKWIPGNWKPIIFSFQPLVFRGNRLTPNNSNPSINPGDTYHSIGLMMAWLMSRLHCPWPWMSQIPMLMSAASTTSLPQESTGRPNSIEPKFKRRMIHGLTSTTTLSCDEASGLQVACPIRRVCKPYTS